MPLGIRGYKMFILDDIVKGIAKKKAAKEATRAAEQQSQANFESGKAQFANQEGSRQGRAGFLASQLKGARALPPEVIAQILAAKQDPTRKGAVMDTSKGAMWGAFGDALGSAGNLAGMYMKGLGMPQAQGGAQATSLRPTSGGQLPGSDFSKMPCPPGVEIC